MRPSRFGFKGKEDLGNGRAVSFVLEQGFDSNNGAQSQGANYAFGREANLTYECAYGKFGMGRIGNFMSGMGSWDPWGPNSDLLRRVGDSRFRLFDVRLSENGQYLCLAVSQDGRLASNGPILFGRIGDRSRKKCRQHSLFVRRRDLHEERSECSGFAGWRMNPTVEGKGYKDGQTYGLALNKQFDGFKPYLAAQYARNSLSVGKNRS